MALPVNIKELLNVNTIEGERLEFKKGWNPEDVLHTMCAFANDMNNWGGGYIIIGIDAKNGVPKLPPFGLKANQFDPIQKKLVELSYKLEPSYSPIIEPVWFEKKQILIIWAPGGDQRPYKAPSTLGPKAEKHYYIRKGSSTVIAKRDDERRLIELSNKIPFDDRINHQTDISDLSLPLILGFLNAAKSDLYEEATQISFSDLCRQMRIVSGTSEYLKPLNVGLLMFSDNPQKYFPGAKIDVVIRADYTGSNFIEKKFIGSILVQLTNVLSYFKTNVVQEHIKKIPGQAESLRFFNYPYEAIEEAMANAVYHRGYDNDNPIEVNIFPDHIEILSFPGPLPPVNKQSLKQKRIVARNYRNRRIGDFLKEMKLTEGRSTGFPTIYSAMARNGSPSPKFDTDDDHTYFLAVLPMHELADGFVKAIKESFPEETLRALQESSEKKPVKKVSKKVPQKGSEKVPQKGSEKVPQKGSEKVPQKSSEKIPQKGSEKIIFLMWTNPYITTNELAENLGISTRAVHKAIQKLKEKGRIKRIGPDKGGYWEILNDGK
jgi:ATP-dependent DNA helicase RecG